VDGLARWLNAPEAWHAHPLAADAGLAAVLVLAVMGVVLWVKGRYWP
jgi:hypothetical protein